MALQNARNHLEAKIVYEFLRIQMEEKRGVHDFFSSPKIMTIAFLERGTYLQSGRFPCVIWPQAAWEFRSTADRRRSGLS